MKKTIAVMALLATASSAQALIGPDHRPVKKLCLRAYANQDGSVSAGCNEVRNNEAKNRRLLQNGCAAGQIAVLTTRTVEIESCLPPGVAQL